MHQWLTPVFVCLVGGLVVQALAKSDLYNSSDGKIAEPWRHNETINYSMAAPRSVFYDEVNCYREPIKTIWPQEIRLWDEVDTLCDTMSDGGGWITIQRPTNGDTSFYRSWDEYKYGFGDLYMGFWIGNENIHRLTSQGFNELRVDLMHNGKAYFAQYSSFSVASEQLNYKLSVSGYSGTAGDSMEYHNNMGFSTKDRDNDGTDVHDCADKYAGGWWYNSCHNANLNGLWNGDHWVDSMWFTISRDRGVRFSEMKIRRS